VLPNSDPKDASVTPLCGPSWITPPPLLDFSTPESMGDTC